MFNVGSNPYRKIDVCHSYTIITPLTALPQHVFYQLATKTERKKYVMFLLHILHPNLSLMSPYFNVLTFIFF